MSSSLAYSFHKYVLKLFHCVLKNEKQIAQKLQHRYRDELNLFSFYSELSVVKSESSEISKTDQAELFLPGYNQDLPPLIPWLPVNVPVSHVISHRAAGFSAARSETERLTEDVFLISWRSW